jgi:hypothetical protein
MQGFLDDGGVEAVEGDAGVVDDKVDALRAVGFLEMVHELFNTGVVCDVEWVEFDL